MYESYVEFESVHGVNTATIDRIDPTSNYEPSNCQWATQLEQARNRTNNIVVEVDSVTYGTLSELCYAYEISYTLVQQRYARGKRGLDLVCKNNLKNPNIIKYPNGVVVNKDDPEQ